MLSMSGQQRPRRAPNRVRRGEPVAFAPQGLEGASAGSDEWAFVVEFEDGTRGLRHTCATSAHRAREQVMLPSPGTCSLARVAHLLSNPMEPGAVEHERAVELADGEVEELVVDTLRKQGKLHDGNYRLVREHGAWVFRQWNDGPEPKKMKGGDHG